VGERPEEIRSEIEETRDRISAEIDELTERYSPGRIAGRKVHGARDAAASVRVRAGAGASGMRQRLTLRGSGHLGEGHTGNGDAGAAGARLAAANSHGQWETGGSPRLREMHGEEARGRSPRRHRGAGRSRPERARAANTVSDWTGGGADYDPYPTDHPPAPGDHFFAAAEGDPHREADSADRGGRPVGDRFAHGHGREIGLASVSVAMAAVGARMIRHAGRRP
jgi:hypothetical protein